MKTVTLDENSWLQVQLCIRDSITEVDEARTANPDLIRYRGTLERAQLAIVNGVAGDDAPELIDADKIIAPFLHTIFKLRQQLAAAQANQSSASGASHDSKHKVAKNQATRAQMLAAKFANRQ